MVLSTNDIRTQDNKEYLVNIILKRYIKYTELLTNYFFISHLSWNVAILFYFYFLMNSSKGKERPATNTLSRKTNKIRPFVSLCITLDLFSSLTSLQPIPLRFLNLQLPHFLCLLFPKLSSHSIYTNNFFLAR